MERFQRVLELKNAPHKVQPCPKEKQQGGRLKTLPYRVLGVQLVLGLAGPRQIVVAAPHREAVVPDANDTLFLVNDAVFGCCVQVHMGDRKRTAS